MAAARAKHIIHLPQDMERILPSIVQITTDVAIGSGFCVEKQGVIATNRHVVGTSPFVELRMHDRTAGIGQVIASHTRLDLAFVRPINLPLPPLVLHDALIGEIGASIWVVGSPWGLAETVTKGIISNVGRETDYRKGVTYIQTDAAINPGNSGGPMLRDDGQVVGMATWIRGDAQNIGFGLPVRFITMELKRLMSEWETLDHACYCTSCGFSTFPAENWCGRCGARVEANEARMRKIGNLDPLKSGSVRCSACGFQSSENLKYCGHCGAVLIPAAPGSLHKKR